MEFSIVPQTKCCDYYLCVKLKLYFTTTFVCFVVMYKSGDGTESEFQMDINSLLPKTFSYIALRHTRQSFLLLSSIV